MNPNEQGDVHGRREESRAAAGKDSNVKATVLTVNRQWQKLVQDDQGYNVWKVERTTEVIPAGENIVGMVNLDMILRPGSDVEPNNVIDAEVEAKFDHPPSVAWAEAFQAAAAAYVPSLIVNDTIIDTESQSDNDPFREGGIPGILVIENSLPDFWDANAYYHGFEDASDRLANDPDSPNGVTYDYAFATEVTRAAVGLIAQEAVPVSGPAQH